MYTKGPWEIEANYHVVKVFRADGGECGRAVTITGPNFVPGKLGQAAADIHLIKAAPRLYEACIVALEEILQYHRHYHKGCEDDCPSNAIIKELLSVINEVEEGRA